MSITPVEKEPSPQHLEGSLKGLSDLTIPKDFLDYGFNNLEALRIDSPGRGDEGVQAHPKERKTPISKAKGTGLSRGNTRKHMNTHTLSHT